MRAVISVVGEDRVGILANVATKCMENNANIVDVSQKVLQNMFTMIMIIEMDNACFECFVDDMEKYGSLNSLKIHVMHEDIFNAMHTI